MNVLYKDTQGDVYLLHLVLNTFPGVGETNPLLPVTRGN